MRLIRVMCSGRVDLEFILRAFYNGQDGVFIGGCKLGECNYVTHGNFDAWSNTHICKKMMEHIGLNPERLMIRFMSGADANILVEATNEISKKVRELGPIGESEGMDENELRFKLEAVRKLVPYMRLVERGRLRVPSKSKEAYAAFFESDEFDRLFDAVFSDKLAISQIMSLLKEKPLSTSDISEKLSLNPSDTSRHLKSSSRHGLISYDATCNCWKNSI